jgi:hypothetical protein
MEWPILGFHPQPYEEIHLHARWCRVLARGLWTKIRDSKSAGWGKKRNQYDGSESFARYDQQDGDEHDNQRDVFASRFGNTVIRASVLQGLPWRDSGKTFAVPVSSDHARCSRAG